MQGGRIDIRVVQVGGLCRSLTVAARLLAFRVALTGINKNSQIPVNS